MPRYSEQFKRDAVALYENNEDLSLNAASAELGINRASLHSWVRSTAPANVPALKPCMIKPKRRLILSESASWKRKTKLREERDILRKAAKYFAEETRW